MRVIGPAFAFIVLANAAFAQDKPDFGGVFSNDPASCSQVTDGMTSLSTEYTLFDPEQGIATIDFHCDFLDTKVSGGWYVATAFCEEPGIQWPDLILFAQNGDQVEVRSLSGKADPDGSLSDGTYTLCTAP